MFYTTAMQYVKSTFPLKDDFLYSARILSFKKREERIIQPIFKSGSKDNVEITVASLYQLHRQTLY